MVGQRPSSKLFRGGLAGAATRDSECSSTRERDGTEIRPLPSPLVPAVAKLETLQPWKLVSRP